MHPVKFETIDADKKFLQLMISLMGKNIHEGFWFQDGMLNVTDNCAIFRFEVGESWQERYWTKKWCQTEIRNMGPGKKALMDTSYASAPLLYWEGEGARNRMLFKSKNGLERAEAPDVNAVKVDKDTDHKSLRFALSPYYLGKVEKIAKFLGTECVEVTTAKDEFSPTRFDFYGAKGKAHFIVMPMRL